MGVGAYFAEWVSTCCCTGLDGQGHGQGPPEPGGRAGRTHCGLSGQEKPHGRIWGTEESFLGEEQNRQCGIGV